MNVQLKYSISELHIDFTHTKHFNGKTQTQDANFRGKKKNKKSATKLTNEFPMLSRRQHNTHVPRVSNNEAKGSLTIRPLCAFPSTSSLSTAGRPLRPEN